MAPSQGSIRGTPTLQSSEPPHKDKVIYSHAGTPTAGGHLAIPPGNTNQGSIALCAIRSVHLLACISSWAQLKNMPPPDKNKAPATVKEKSVKTVKKKTKEGDAKEEKGGEKKTKKMKKNKSTKKEKA